jgi:hypothetical protein
VRRSVCGSPIVFKPVLAGLFVEVAGEEGSRLLETG